MYTVFRMSQAWPPSCPPTPIQDIGRQLAVVENKLAAIDKNLAGIDKKLEILISIQEKTMALVQVDSDLIKQVVTGVATLKTDTGTALTNILAKLAGIQAVADPATASSLVGVISDISTLDASIKTADPGAPVAAAVPTV